MAKVADEKQRLQQMHSGVRRNGPSTQSIGRWCRWSPLDRRMHEVAQAVSTRWWSYARMHECTRWS
eukprot:137961-Pleurochrysis_carterae.AAC.1